MTLCTLTPRGRRRQMSRSVTPPRAICLEDAVVWEAPHAAHPPPRLTLNLSSAPSGIHLDVPICEKGLPRREGASREGQLPRSGAEWTSPMSGRLGNQWRHLAWLWGRGCLALGLPSKTFCSWLWEGDSPILSLPLDPPPELCHQAPHSVSGTRGQGPVSTRSLRL